MTHIDWTGILAGRGTVDFSSLEIPESRDEFETDVAQLSLHRGFFIDVGWNSDTARYVVTLFRDTFENALAEVECSTPSDVVEAVRQLIDATDRTVQSASSLHTNSSKFQFQDA